MYKSIGFPISLKENEKRRALFPTDIKKIKNRNMLFFEKGYGEVLGFDDDFFKNIGCHVVSREEVLNKDIICDPKIGDAEYLNSLHNQTIFGWIHAVQNYEITEKILKGNLTAIAWEDMFEDGRHLFWRNNEIAGEAAILHAFQCYGLMPYNAKVALIGRGNVGMGAYKILTLLGADVHVYNRKTEDLLRKEISKYDVVVNAVLWDTSRKDHIISIRELKKMKKGSLIIDISCDRNGGIETSIPTTIENPCYISHGIIHYVVDHTPSLFHKTATIEISKVMVEFIDKLIENKESKIIKEATCIDKGIIIDKRIIEFQKREVNTVKNNL